MFERTEDRVDAAVANVDRLAQFIYETEGNRESWDELIVSDTSHTAREQYRDHARNMIRRFNDLEDILADLLAEARRF
jgi:hypothetical protein